MAKGIPFLIVLFLLPHYVNLSSDTELQIGKKNEVFLRQGCFLIFSK